uniref:Phenol hydroxylase n=1 Tax=Caenorhabditis tropicalis TaxID=1561998 RepID=A0A1I7TNI6_9PELO
MPVQVEVPPTTYERLQQYKEKFSDALRHPDSPDWYKKETHESVKKDLLWAAPYDARFPQNVYKVFEKSNKSFSYRVIAFQDFCPGFWTERWDELLAEGRFPAKFDR